MRDIETATDIKLLVDTFYDKIRKDETVGYIFQQIIGDDWSAHLPVMYSFWETILLDKPGYTGNAVKKHIDIDRKIQLENDHYTRWMQLWVQTVSALFKGEVAENAKKRAEAMMGLIRMKVDMARTGKPLL